MNWQHLRAFVWLRWRLLAKPVAPGGGHECRTDDDRVDRCSC